jgi:hypothetical protein
MVGSHWCWLVAKKAGERVSMVAGWTEQRVGLSLDLNRDVGAGMVGQILQLVFPLAARFSLVWRVFRYGPGWEGCLGGWDGRLIRDGGAGE